MDQKSHAGSADLSLDNIAVRLRRPADNKLTKDCVKRGSVTKYLDPPGTYISELY